MLFAAFVMATVATTLVAAVPMYSTAIVEAGLRSTLDEALPSQSGLEATYRASPAVFSAVTDQIELAARQQLPGGRRTVALGETDSFGVPPDLSDATAAGDVITSIGVLVAAEPMIEFVAGSPDSPADGDAIASSLHVDAASELQLGVGDIVVLDGRNDEPVTVQVVALFEPVDRFDRLWFDQPQVRDGVTLVGTFNEAGPFLVDSSAFARVARPATMRWRGLVDPTSITTADTTALRLGAAGIERFINDAVNRNDAEIDVAVATDLPAMLLATDTALGSTAAVVAAVLLQLVGVALYGLALAAMVLVASRAAETSLLRSRGADARQLGMMAAAEGLVIAIPAVVIGPPLARQVVNVVGRWGPVATAELDLDGAVSRSAVVGSCLVGIAVAVIVTWPAVRSAQSFAIAQSSRTRPSGPNLMQRTGLDIGISLLAVAGLWQLTRSSAATGDLGGRLGTDPVLVFAPALGVVAASLLTLRLISLIASAVQSVTSRRKGLSVALAGWELARRPGRTARTSVLVVLSVTVGTFAAVHGSSWEQSQRDQADASVSADGVVVPENRPTAPIEPSLLSSAYRQAPGVSAAVPIDRPRLIIPGGVGTVATVAVDSRELGDVLRVRDDLVSSDIDWTALRQPIDLGGLPLGDVTGDLTVDYSAQRTGSDPEGFIRIVLTVADRFGSLHRVDAEPLPAAASTEELVFPLTNDAIPGFELALSGPLELVGIELTVPMVIDRPDPNDEEVRRRPAMLDVELDNWAVGGRSVVLPDRSLSSRPLRASVNTRSTPSVAADVVDGHFSARIDTGVSVQSAASITGSFHTLPVAESRIAGDEIVLPAYVTAGFLDATQLQVGDVAAGRVSGAPFAVRIEGVLPSVPFAADESAAVLVDWATLVAGQYVSTVRSFDVDSWALSIDERRADDLERALIGEPFNSAGFDDRRDLARELASDPVTVGLSGSLMLALFASLIVAVVGLILTAVVGARERRPSFAVLRAMGTRADELRVWLLLETVPLVGLSAVVGLASGVLLARVALPSLAVARDGTRSIPEPVLVVPWPTLGAVLAVAVTAGMALPFVTGRLLRRHRTADELRIGAAP